MTEPTALIVFAAALVTALATGLGALPLLSPRARERRWRAAGSAAAAGLMLAASHSMIAEGMALNGWRTLLGLVAGVGAIMLAKRVLQHPDLPGIEHLASADGARMVLIVGIMTAHSAAEGIGLGVAFGGGRDLGELLTVAITLQNIPEGLAIALILVPRGVPVLRAAGWAVVSSLPQPLLAVPAFLMVTVFASILPYGLGLAAGAMLWIAFSELLPDASEGMARGPMGTVAALSFAAMLAVTLVMG
ncbi:ZIP family metal transporter [Plastorhodobacter daqingensis]|uniref:ZIP family metal transporter n=1 Tax=Plastorhodobacter daqingensis TaxID=1387281 RepID=A0ABW2ULT1_9RHOB